jgi:nitrate reductase (cytochrome), electron transfer subunit
MTRMPRLVIGLTATASLLWLLAGVVRTQSPQTGAVSDRQLGLRKTTLADDPLPPVATYAEAAPGEGGKLPRAYDGAPPLIPHTIDGFGTITADDNTCLLCHQNGATDPGDPPQVPRSHLVDLRHAPDTVREAVAGARWVCTSCHVPQTDARPLVGSRFRN